MLSFENNTSAFFWELLSFSSNSSLLDDAGCKSAFFMESASSPGRADCRNSISLLSGFVVISWRGEKSPQTPFPHYRNGLFFCFIECERHGDKVSKSGENIRESSCTSLNFFRHSSCPDWAYCLFRAMIFLWSKVFFHSLVWVLFWLFSLSPKVAFMSWTQRSLIASCSARLLRNISAIR